MKYVVISNKSFSHAPTQIRVAHVPERASPIPTIDPFNEKMAASRNIMRRPVLHLPTSLRVFLSTIITRLSGNVAIFWSQFPSSIVRTLTIRNGALPRLRGATSIRKKIDLAEVRALQNGSGRRPMKAPWVRPPRRRVGPDSCDAPRRIGSLGQLMTQSGNDGAQKNSKRSREVEKGAPHNVSGGNHRFVEGVNRRDRAGSFWDMSDPDLGWSMGKPLIGDHDVLSLASTFQLREERSRNSESKLHEEIAMLREELLKKQKESDEKSKSCETLRVELKEKSKSYDVLRQELQQLVERYSVELTIGEHFLNSALGKTLLTSNGEKAIEGYRASSAFRDEVLRQALTIHDQVVIDCRRQLRETKLVSEDIVRMIEPSVPEPRDENNEDLLGTLDVLDDIDDDEMIELFARIPFDGSSKVFQQSEILLVSSNIV
ncbi:hypothetical protein F511_27642 [Dorcoceras hygrometricum]|uniref:Uncharacterized protein n=1 Tax=Dorcoceras hygrometricum TaxID=472368 RepID=A0A2Z7BI01_9LAMI|nr:hypothetical protein F511_27642 [Dorcoceras hygrometricum]